MKPFDIFLSYAHEDADLMNRVRQQLVIHDRLNNIRKWWDRKITPGNVLNEEIEHHLSDSDIILLFISPSFFDSNYCYDVEMIQALQQHRDGRSVVIPVILRPCAWMTSPFGHLTALPSDALPLSKWTNIDDGALDIANGVMRAVDKLHEK